MSNASARISEETMALVSLRCNEREGGSDAGKRKCRVER